MSLRAAGLGECKLYAISAIQCCSIESTRLAYITFPWIYQTSAACPRRISNALDGQPGDHLVYRQYRTRLFAVASMVAGGFWDPFRIMTQYNRQICLNIP